MKAEENTQDKKEETKQSEYNLTEKVNIQQSVLKNLIKLCENSTNHNIEGLLYGYDDDEKINVENLIVLNKNTSINDIELIVK